jgi:hypothetical protein
MYAVGRNYMFTSLLIYSWLEVSTSKDHHQINIYTKLKNADACNTKHQFYEILFNSLVVFI